MLDIPGIGPNFEPAGLTDGNVFALNTETAAYVWDGAALELIAVPGALFTRLRGMRADRTLYGFFVAADGTGHGFVARPAAPASPCTPAHKAPGTPQASVAQPGSNTARGTPADPALP